MREAPKTYIKQPWSDYVNGEHRGWGRCRYEEFAEFFMTVMPATILEHTTGPWFRAHVTSGNTIVYAAEWSSRLAAIRACERAVDRAVKLRQIDPLPQTRREKLKAERQRAVTRRYLAGVRP